MSQLVRNDPRLGRIPSPEDSRDRILTVRQFSNADLPPFVDLRTVLSGAYDQGDLGSCVEHGISAAVEFLLKHRKMDPLLPIPARGLLYKLTLFAQGTPHQDAGSDMRTALQILNTDGICGEHLYPYDTETLIAADMPDSSVLTAAATMKFSYLRVQQTREALLDRIASGYPVVFGTYVYDQFQSDEAARTGIITMPTATSVLEGGHCLCGWGYNVVNPKDEHVIVRNSYGPAFGDGGYVKMPLEYLLDPNLTDELWTIDL